MEENLEKEVATHSSILAWEIPWTEEPGGLQSMGSQRAGHDLVIEQEHDHRPQLTYSMVKSNKHFLCGQEREQAAHSRHFYSV